MPVGAGSTAYILLHQQRYKPAPFFDKPRFWKQAIALIKALIKLDSVPAPSQKMKTDKLFYRIFLWQPELI
ncbi:MAG: hypothetical protein P5674_26230, partial [Limnospira sp. PMC 289.06]|nr:hypothetical protein [Limnospira sp. PMC 289.06]